MSLYQTTSIGLSVLDNIQTFQANQKLNRLLSAQDQENINRQNATVAQVELNRFARILSDEHRNTDPHAAYWNALTFFMWVKNLSGGVGLFSSPADRDQFLKCEANAEQLHNWAKRALSSEVIQELSHAQITMTSIPILQNLYIWRKVYSKMGLPVIRNIMWSGRGDSFLAIIGSFTFYIFGGLLVVLLLLPIGIICVAAGNESMANEIVFGGAKTISIFLAIFGFFLPFIRRKRTAKFSRMVTKVGGFFTAKAKISDVRKIITDFENQLIKIGLPENALQSSNLAILFKTSSSEIKNINANYRLALNLEQLPKELV